LLWQHGTGSGVEAGPISYRVDSTQFVALAVGHNLPSSRLDLRGKTFFRGRAQLIAFALDARGGRIPTESPPQHEKPDIRPDEFVETPPAELQRGRFLYSKYCGRCHGSEAVSGGYAPDLRYSTRVVRQRFAEVVLGEWSERGMPSFAGVLSDVEVRQLQAYIMSRSRLVVNPQ
jgi:quinohemoprotein ethanol dehydrogenase